jgi:hypothetical protein
MSKTTIAAARTQGYSCGEQLKFLLTCIVIAALGAGLVLFIIKLDSDTRHVESPVADEHIALCLLVAGACLLAWMTVNYFSTPVHRGIYEGGYGTQFLYNLLNQIAVKHLRTSSIESLTEAEMLRDFLRGIAYLLIIGYCCAICQKRCSGCNVPYAMVSIGLIVCYVIRGILLVRNGLHAYRRLRVMEMKVRAYQESLDMPSLFGSSSKQIHELSQGTYSHAFESLFWALSLGFALIGGLWVMDHKCNELCPATFHVYQYLMVSVLLAESLSLLTKCMLLYYARVTHIEGFEAIVEVIAKYKQKSLSQIN